MPDSAAPFVPPLSSPRTPAGTVARCVSLGIVIAFAGMALSGCALLTDPTVTHYSSDHDSGEESNQDGMGDESPSGWTMPATEGCPPGFLEHLIAGDFVLTSAEVEFADDPLAQMPFLQHICIGSGLNGSLTQGFFGGDVDTLRALGEELADYGFYPYDEFEGQDGFWRMTWKRDSPGTLFRAMTYGDNPSKNNYGREAVGLMPPSFSQVVIAPIPT